MRRHAGSSLLPVGSCHQLHSCQLENDRSDARTRFPDRVLPEMALLTSRPPGGFEARSALEPPSLVAERDDFA